MKIHQNISSTTRQFGQLYGGDIFEFYGCLYIKLIKFDQTTNYGETAARLSDGQIKDFISSEEVISRKDVKIISE